MYQRFFVAFAFVLALSPLTMAQEPGDRATVQMRDGTKVEGRIEELAGGTLFLRVSQHDQRRINVTDIALIDKKGGASGLPDTEIREARGAEHVLLLAGGNSVKGRLVTIKGGEGSSDPGPRTYVFRTADGERQVGPADVARIYLGSYPFEAAVSGHPADVAPVSVPAGGVRVPATAAWVSTGLNVRKGDWVTFNTTGEVQLSDNASDRARSAGSTRVARLAPLPNVNAGALIGRIGMNGQPFGIGDQASVPMPAAGVLYLSVNDDERGDNAGEFIVVVSRSSR